MTFYQLFPKTKCQQQVTAVCQHCERQYQIGVNGTVMGCDDCLGIERNPVDHTIIEATGSEHELAE